MTQDGTDRLLDRLVEAVNLRSENAALLSPDEPQAGGERLMAELVGSWCDELGLDWVLEPTGLSDQPNCVAVLPGRRSQTVCLQAHIDTVPLSAEQSAQAVIAGDRVAGRGSCDAKGPLVAMVEAIRILKERAGGDHPSVMLAATVDEEYGGQGAASFVQAHGDEISAAVVGEPTELQIVNAHRGAIRFDITIKGRAAHSSVPTLGHNAVHAAGVAISRMVASDNWAIPPSLAAHPQIGYPVWSVVGIRGGHNIKTVPEDCSIRIDRRMNPGEQQDEVFAYMAEHISELFVDQDVAIEVREPFNSSEPLDTEADSPWVRALQIGLEATLGRVSPPVGMPYGSDARFFASRSIPTVVFGPGDIAVAHGPDEFVLVSDIATASEGIAHGLKEYLR